jgi:hypothetical protein
VSANALLLWSTLLWSTLGLHCKLALWEGNVLLDLLLCPLPSLAHTKIIARQNMKGTAQGQGMPAFHQN